MKIAFFSSMVSKSPTDRALISIIQQSNTLDVNPSDPSGYDLWISSGVDDITQQDQVTALLNYSGTMPTWWHLAKVLSPQSQLNLNTASVDLSVRTASIQGIVTLLADTPAEKKRLADMGLPYKEVRVGVEPIWVKGSTAPTKRCDQFREVISEPDRELTFNWLETGTPANLLYTTCTPEDLQSAMSMVLECERPEDWAKVAMSMQVPWAASYSEALEGLFCGRLCDVLGDFIQTASDLETNPHLLRGRLQYLSRWTYAATERFWNRILGELSLSL